MSLSSKFGEENDSPQTVLRWIETAGGPHILTTEEDLADWKGCENWNDNSENDPSDYARACRSSSNWLSLIPSTNNGIVVLGGDVGPIAWLSTSDTSGTFVQWIGFDGDAAVLAMLAQDELGEIEHLQEEEILLKIGPSGRMVLLDAAINGLQAGPEDLERLLLQPGRYRLKAYYLETADCMAVVRQLSRLEDV